MVLIRKRGYSDIFVMKKSCGIGLFYLLDMMRKVEGWRRKRMDCLHIDALDYVPATMKETGSKDGKNEGVHVKNPSEPILPNMSKPSQLMTEYTRPALYAALPVLSQGKKWVLLYRYMANSFYSAMEIGDEVGCQRNARIARASRVEIHNAIDAWIAGMLLILDAVCEYQIVRTESKNVCYGNWRRGMLLISDVVCEYQIVRTESRNVGHMINRPAWMLYTSVMLCKQENRHQEDNKRKRLLTIKESYFLASRMNAYERANFVDEKHKIHSTVIELQVNYKKIIDSKLIFERKFCLELLHEYGLLAARPVDIPLPENTILSFDETKDDKYLFDFTSYQKLMGKLIYLTNTRPYINYVVHCLSQHMHSLLQSHFKVALRVLRYLKGSPRCGIQFYIKSDLKLKAYVDADWAKCLKTRKSITRLCVFFGKSFVSWKINKQATLSKSSFEAEYRSMSSASCEIVWLGNLLHSLGLKILYPVELCCENSSAIQITANPVFHESNKHFELDVHFVMEKVLAGVIKRVKVPSNLQTADIFTKCLGVV
ncbi:ribonuclease H-like domain-containing protein [Tanacetum coccineum]